MPGVSKFGFAALRPKTKAMYTGFLLAFIVGVLEADFIRNPSSTWYDGYIKCRQSGLDMATWWDVTPDMNITYPIWFNGFEVRVNYLGTSFANDVRMTFEEGRRYCQNQPSGSHMDVPLVNHTNLHLFGFSIITWYWIQAVEIGQFLNSEDLTVYCFVLIGFDRVRKDNCTKHYSSICINETVHDAIRYVGQESLTPNYGPTSSSTTMPSSVVTSEFMTSLVTSETYLGVDVATSTLNTSFHLNDSTSDPKTDEDVKTSSISIWMATTLGPCLLVPTVIVAYMCLKRKHGNNTRTTFQHHRMFRRVMATTSLIMMSFPTI
ncbi:uncharacterized protein LOC127861227 isoform X2 [Dreissena polymorpha]|uniref:uncharacterized protein LOC127861227 isoform X2 n=1 Tax=Dreissena polymorpha TaxID=45954 RepID=UPI0022650FE1|nr:uncharacterized protein LOC127861227 isoform X2 [Dreissena polymorpha]